MKGKKGKLVAGSIAAVIWIVVITGFFKGNNISDPPVTGTPPGIPLHPSIKKRDTSVLDLDYADPFLKSLTRARVRKDQNSKPVAKKKKKVREEEKITWPDVNYAGLVISRSDKKKIGWIQINGKQHLVKEGQLIGEIKVVSLEENFALLEQGKEQAKYLLPVKKK